MSPELPDVVLGCCLIQPDNHKVSGPLQEVQLPARVFDVLLYLIRHHGRAVSRHELIQHIWSGNDAVGQKGLTNAIWQLRKAFEQAGLGQELILTIAKTGYELAVTPQLSPQAALPDSALNPALNPALQLASDAVTETAPQATTTADGQGATLPAARATGNRVVTPQRWGLLALLVALLAAFWWQVQPRPAVSAPVLKPDIRPRQLTAAVGVEELPAFSKDGRYMAFMADVPGQAPAIYRLDLQQPQQSAERLTPPAQYATSPAWSPDQQQLAYLAVDGRECRLMLLDLRSRHSEPLSGCVHQYLQNTLSWSAHTNMLAFASANELGGVNIQGRDMQSGRIERLSAPRADTQDYPLAFANHSAQLAYVRQTKHLGIIYLRQPDGSSKALTKTPLYVYSLAWSPDDQFLYFSSVWQGELSILQLSLQSGEISPLSYAKVPGRMTVRLGAQPELVYTQYNSEEQLYRIKAGQAPVLLPQTLGRELYPEYAAAADRLLFMSSRSGRFELWHSDLAQQRLQQVSLSEDGAADIASLAPDGRQFVVWAAAAGGKAAQLLLGSLTDGSLRPVSEQPFESQHASWSQDSRSLYFSSNAGGDWQIWQLDLQSGISQQHTLNGGIFAREAPDGSLLYVKALSGGIWRQQRDGSEQLLIDDLAVSDWGNWLVDAQGIYYLRRQADSDLWLFKAWHSDHSSELFRLPGRSVKAGRSITAVSADEFIVSMYGRREANLMAVPLIAQ